jgi:hypothetical protein
VWTSFIVRASAAMMTLFPSFQDMVMRGTAKRDEAQRAAAARAAASHAIEQRS